MLSDLVVEGLGVIDRAELSLDRGCSALTGETGAGKTLVVAALSLLLGGRADRTLVRTGADEARVEGRFVIPSEHEAVAVLRARGLLDDDTGEPVEVVLSRTVGPRAGGRAGGNVRVNGRLASVAVLAELGATLAEIAGQHDQGRLAQPAFRRAVLDAYAGPEAVALAAELGDAVAEARRARRRADELRASERERSRELDVLAFEIAEIEGEQPREGEGNELAAQADRLEHAEALAAGIDEALGALRGEGGAGEVLAAARRCLAGLVDKDPELEALAKRLEDAAYEIADVGDELVGRKVEPDPGSLEGIRSRLAALARLRRKYGEDESEILRYLERARTRAEELAGHASDLAAALEGAALGLDRATSLAERLGRLRRDAAPALAKEVETLMEGLAMPDARFEVRFEGCELKEGGLEDIDFVVSVNPGEELRPVAKVASGGELSRIALALHLVAAPGGAGTVVFDEVDAGVGGEAAQEVGRALAEVAARTGAQVVVVTHLPQVAAFADSHFRVCKAVAAGRTVASVERVDGDERIEELSRMLAGLPRSARAREHAQELLDLAAARLGAA